MATGSHKHTPTVDINAEEAEKAIQALHKSYLKHVSRDSKTKHRKSTESEPGESTVYFSRVPNVQQDSGSSMTDKGLEISRPRSIHGEPRLRSLSTGDLNEAQGGIRKRYTIPVRAKSWRVENDERLINLDGELRYIIGSLGQLEISRDRRDNGSPMVKHAHGKEAGTVSEVGSGDGVDGIRRSVEPFTDEASSNEVFDETLGTINELSTLHSATSSFDTIEESSSLDSSVIARTLSTVQEESPSIPRSNRTNSASPVDKSQADQQTNEKKERKALGPTPEKQTLVTFKDDIKPLLTSTPKRPKSLDLSSDISVFDESSLKSTENQEQKPSTSASESLKSAEKNGEVKTRKIKMTKGRRPFSAVEPGNIPTSPTEAFVKLREFRSTGDSDSLDAGSPDNDSVEVAVEAKEEETTPQRPPRKKPLTPSPSFTIPCK